VADSLDAKAKPKQKRRCVTSSVIAIRAPTYKEASRARAEEKKKKERKRRRKKEEKERSRERRKIPGETGLASRSPYRLFTSRYLRQVLRNGFTSPFPSAVPRNVQERFIERDIEIPLGCFFKSISSLGILDESGAIVSSSDVRAELFIAMIISLDKIRRLM